MGMVVGSRRPTIILIKVDRDLRRVFFLGARIHHGAIGIASIATGLVVKRRVISHVLIVAGAVLIADDRHDFPWIQ